MKIKELEKTVNLAWSPKSQYPILLAAGTTAQLDASFNTSAALELYKLNLEDPSFDLELCASVPSENRFHKLVWSSWGHGDELDKSLIAGGCDAGRIVFYNTAKLLKNETGYVTCTDKHTGPVRALEFNPFQRNLLASGAAQSQLFIWDVNNLSAPMSPQDDGTYTHPTDDIMSLAWHKQGPEVQHILATIFPTRCVVWDLKKNKAIMKLTDPVDKVRWKDMTWSPRISTQLCLASEDDSYPVIQLWDLRMATGAIKVFSGHRKGVLSLAWCNEDPDLIVSCGKDNKLIFWDANGEGENGDILCDIPLSSQWNFEVKWCPSNPSFISTSSLDSRASVYSLSGGPHVTETTHRIADSFPGVDHISQTVPPQQIHPEQSFIRLPKAPKWIKKPVGVSFGFGGKLVSFNASEPTIVNVSQVVTEHELMFKFKELLDALEQNKFEEHCEKKAENAINAEVAEVWNFIKHQFINHENETFRGKVCSILGTSEAFLSQKLKALNIFDENSINANDAFVNDSIPNMSRIGPADDADLFDSLANQDEKLRKNNISNGFAVTELQPLKKPLKITPSDDLESAICDALLLGDKELAVDLLIRRDRMADALALASTGSAELMAKAQMKYFEKNDHYLTTLISAVVIEDWCNIVETCDLTNWNHILVAILNHTKEDEFRALCELLAQRLLDEGDDTLKKNALVCFVCAGNINRLLDSWKIIDRTSQTDVQELVEIGLLMKEAIKLRGGDAPVCGTFAKVLVQYAELLASQGYLTAAYTYLGEISDDESINMLKERLACALGFIAAYPSRRETQPPSKPMNQFQPQIPPQQSAFVAYGSHPPTITATPYNTVMKPIPKQPPVNQVSPMSMTASQLPAFNAVKPTSSTAAAPFSAAAPPFSASHNAPYSPYAPPQSHQVAPPPTMQMVNSQPFGQPPVSAQFAKQQSSVVSAPVPPPPVAPVMARSTPTPPAPPPASQVPYNLRQTPDHMAAQSKSKYVVDPSVQGGPGHRGSFSGGAFQNATNISTPFHAVSPFSAQNDSSAYPMSNSAAVASFPMSQPNATSYMTNHNVPNPLMQPNKPTPTMTAGMSQMMPPSTPSMPPSMPSMPPSMPSMPASMPSMPPMPSMPSNATTMPLSGPSKLPSRPPSVASVPAMVSNAPSMPTSAPTMPPSGLSKAPSMPPSVANPPTMSPGAPSMSASNIAKPMMPLSRAPNTMIPPAMEHPSLPPANPPNLKLHPVGTTAMPFSPPNAMNHGYQPAQPSAQILQPNAVQQPSQAPPTQYSLPSSGWNDPPSLSFEKPISNQIPAKLSNEDRELARITSRPPIPEEHIHIQTVFEELKNQCANKTNNAQMKRKLADVTNKLELLYIGIATHKLSPQTLALLHEIVKAIQQGNYQACLSYHTQLVSGSDFATIASFISSIKILVQCALQLEVYI